MSHIPRYYGHAHRILDCPSNGLSSLGAFNRIPVNIITAIILSRSMYAISSFLIVNCLGFSGTEETVSLIEVIGVSIMNVSFPFNQLYDIGERIHFIRRVYWEELVLFTRFFLMSYFPLTGPFTNCPSCWNCTFSCCRVCAIVVECSS